MTILIPFTIDELTACLKDTQTGDPVEIEVVRIKRKSFLAKFNKSTGWYVNWSKFPPNVEVYALVLIGTMDIQGMIALEKDDDAQAIHIRWACTAPHNNVWENGIKNTPVSEDICLLLLEINPSNMVFADLFTRKQ